MFKLIVSITSCKADFLLICPQIGSSFSGQTKEFVNLYCSCMSWWRRWCSDYGKPDRRRGANGDKNGKDGLMIAAQQRGCLFVGLFVGLFVCWLFVWLGGCLFEDGLRIAAQQRGFWFFWLLIPAALPSSVLCVTNLFLPKILVTPAPSYIIQVMICFCRVVIDEMFETTVEKYQLIDTWMKI